MKRMLFLVAVVACVLGLAAVAHAGTNSTYAAWDATGANATEPTPHKGYETATNKCAVCHAVHKAEADGELLLRSTVADACTYCHVTAGGAGLIIVYNANVAAYNTSNAYAHNPGGGECVDCHSVHGADTIDGANSEKILKHWDADGSFKAYSTNALNKFGGAAAISALANDDAQITAWCTGCHKYFIESYDESSTAIQYNKYDHATHGYVWAYAGSHVMTSTAGGYTNPVATTTSGTDVAWATSEYCRSCHDAGVTDNGPGTVQYSFPHYTPDYYRFMVSKAAASGSATETVDGTEDGLCLKCHDDSTATTDIGVGISF